MMPLENVVAALVTDHAAEAQSRAGALVAAGADVRTCGTAHELVTLLTGEVIDAVVVGEMTGAPAREAILGVLRQEFRAQMLPVLILAATETRLGDLSAAGELVSALAASAPDVALIDALVRLLGPLARANQASRERQQLGDRLAAEASVSDAMRTATRAYGHDSGVFLGIVIGFACNLRDHIAGPLLPAQHDNVKRIIDAASSAASMLTAHTSSAVFKTGTSAAPRPPTTTLLGRRMLVDVSLLTEQVVMLFSYTARQAGIALTFAGDEPIHVWGDALQLKQVTLNLVNNAIKFSPRGGRVEVTVRQPGKEGGNEPPCRTHGDIPLPSVGERSGASARRRVELVVRDTGPGIPEKDRKRIFGHGVRLDRDAGTPGSGIGLGVVRELVALHGGTVRVEGPPEGGAAFVVSLPIDRRQRREERANITPSPPPSTSTSTRPRS